ncbi:MAG: hypothetical protein EZS28_005318 [Streblomastix strix]|uniref:SPRY domain-containing protein n=1 Tax=Streblomastix strix TaxID=222440 RepID=A0A5J4WXQ7_9EUKA|nr:MAG: hypothetical protein EZS28_005318 [Streblomastix strix]
MSNRFISQVNISSLTPEKAIILQKFEFTEIKELIEEISTKEGPEEKVALRKLISYMEDDIGLCMEINELTNFKTIAHDILECDQDLELKQLLDRALVLLDEHKPTIPFDAESLLDHFRPILLKENRLQRLANSNIVKSRNSNWHICPFDPVITVPGARIRPITLEKVRRKPVQKQMLIPQFTDEAGIVFCELIFSNAMLNDQNTMRIGILDADLPMTDSTTFVAGKDKGGISYDNSGSIWINGKWDDPIDPRDKWDRGMHIGMEVNMNETPRALRFFVEGRQITRYVTNIPERIRFFATPIMMYDSFQVQSILRLKQPKGQRREGDIAFIANEEFFDYTTGMDNR